MYKKCTGNAPYWKARPIGNNVRWCSAKLKCGRCLNNEESCSATRPKVWEDFSDKLCDSCEDRFLCYTMSEEGLMDYNRLMNDKRQHSND